MSSYEAHERRLASDAIYFEEGVDARRKQSWLRRFILDMEPVQKAVETYRIDLIALEPNGFVSRVATCK